MEEAKQGRWGNRGIRSRRSPASGRERALGANAVNQSRFACEWRLVYSTVPEPRVREGWYFVSVYPTSLRRRTHGFGVLGDVATTTLGSTPRSGRRGKGRWRTSCIHGNFVANARGSRDCFAVILLPIRTESGPLIMRWRVDLPSFPGMRRGFNPNCSHLRVGEFFQEKCFFPLNPFLLFSTFCFLIFKLDGVFPFRTSSCILTEKRKIKQ